MVFLTAQLWLRNRVTDRYFRIQEVLKHARHFRGRKNRCYRLAVRTVIRAFVKCTKARYLKKKNMRTLWINRITAASQEHGLKYPALIGNLVKVWVSVWVPLKFWTSAETIMLGVVVLPVVPANQEAEARGSLETDFWAVVCYADGVSMLSLVSIW
ncbi:MRPL20 isoform 5 [Pan troglodytes]|uniref:Mitochondrial ribosomal protein L20 n=2 Tax=Pan troglodytes TaxID=9598 RepID=A0A2I3TBD6_PANTR|nr:39S ribosomal protein L20, mitochondrial isoform X1 [Pan troglodytes]PNI13239.1 MRPL20 isoform 5 [Pan troglodytes]